MLDKDKLIKMRSTITEIVCKMESYIINDDDIEPVELMPMYIELRDINDILREELFQRGGI